MPVSIGMRMALCSPDTAASATCCPLCPKMARALRAPCSYATCAWPEYSSLDPSPANDALV